MTMKIFYDTEFIDNGTTIDLISIGAVTEYGNTFYAVSNEYDADAASDWVRQHVIPKVGPWGCHYSRMEIRNDIAAFFREVTKPDESIELWANYAAYDHVVLAQLWGPMSEMPSRIPMYTNDLQQLCRAHPEIVLPPEPDNAHNALKDALWLRDAYNVLTKSGW